mmetsp:Transcript_48224/g.134032  ORF Transcript_48224/g.134032 Transcript_48224/m.134032 type:complete len:109 (-) Transcript_48224:123-449(-)
MTSPSHARLRGQARHVDTATLIYENKQMMAVMRSLERQINHLELHLRCAITMADPCPRLPEVDVAEGLRKEVTPDAGHSVDHSAGDASCLTNTCRQWRWLWGLSSFHP